MSNIIITTHWSDGDIIPFIRIGERLKKRGHKVAILTHCYYEKQALEAGLEFTPWDTREQYEAMIRDMGSYTDAIAGLDEIHAFRNKYESLSVRLREFEKIQQYCTQKDTVILAKNRSSVAALMAAEKYRYPIALGFICSYEIGSMINFNSLHKEQLREEANQMRSSVGLPPIDSWLAWQSSPKVQIGLWPEWFTTEMREWPHPIKTVGFPLDMSKFEAVGMIPEEISEILKEEPAPILITGGTSKQIRPDFYSSAIEACRILGRKTILVTRYKEFVPENLPANIRWFTYVPLDTILPYVGAVIHHGGIGTIGGSVYAATPQMVLAYHVDRPLNGSKIKSVGVGSYLPPSRWDPRLIAEELKKLLKPEFKEKCVAFAKKLPENDALEEACKIVENIAGKEEYTITHEEILGNTHYFSTGPATVEKDEQKSKLQSLSPEVREFILKKRLQAKKD